MPAATDFVDVPVFDSSAAVGGCFYERFFVYACCSEVIGGFDATEKVFTFVFEDFPYSGGIAFCLYDLQSIADFCYYEDVSWNQYDIARL